jgi:hypothetical protein
MSDDLLQLLTGGKRSLTEAAAPASDVDALARMGWGEARGEPDDGVAAALYTALNRARASGRSVADVVADPGQYQGYNADALAVPQDDADLQRVTKIAADVLSGKVKDPTGGATHFLNKDAMAAEGKALPSWAAGDGQQIGAHTFYAPGSSGDAADLLSLLRAGKASAQTAAPQPAAAEGAPAPASAAQSAPVTPQDEAVAPAGDGSMVDAKTGKPLTAAQTQTYAGLVKTGDLDMNAPPGSKKLPLAQRPDGAVPDMPGVYYVDQAGQLQQTPTSGGESNALTSLANGGLLGFGNKIMAATAALKATHGNPADPMFGKLFQQAETIYDQAHRTYANQHPVADAVSTGTGNALTLAPSMALGGELLAPAVKALGPVGEFIAGQSGRGAPGVANKIVSLASRGANGAIQGGAAGAATSQQSDRPIGDQIGAGALAGGAMSVALPEAVTAGVSALKHVMGADSGVAPEVAALAKTAVDKYGINLRTSQIKGVGDRAMAVADSERIGQGGTGYATNNAQQKTAFTKAVASTFGEDADKLSPEVLSRAKTRIGGVFEDVAKNTTITDVDALQTKLGSIVHDAQQVLPDSEVTPLLKQVENIGSTISDGKMSGQTYQALTRKGSALDVAQSSSNMNIRHYAGEIRDALDDALEASASPSDLKALQNARWEYKNLMTIKGIAAKANVEGEISPALLNGAVNISFKNRAFAGAGDLGELAQIGQTFMKEPPNSGTAPRLAHMLAGGGALADIGLAVHDPVLALKLAAGAAAAAGARQGSRAVTGAYNLSPSIRNRLIDSAISGAGVPRDMGALPATPYLDALNDNAGLLGSLAENRLLRRRN